MNRVSGLAVCETLNRKTPSVLQNRPDHHRVLVSQVSHEFFYERVNHLHCPYEMVSGSACVSHSVLCLRVCVWESGCRAVIWGSLLFMSCLLSVSFCRCGGILIERVFSLVSALDLQWPLAPCLCLGKWPAQRKSEHPGFVYLLFFHLCFFRLWPSLAFLSPEKPSRSPWGSGVYLNPESNTSVR